MQQILVPDFIVRDYLICVTFIHYTHYRPSYFLAISKSNYIELSTYQCVAINNPFATLP